MRQLTLMFTAMLVMVLLGTAAQAERTKRAIEEISAEGAERLEISLDFGAGQLEIFGEDIPEAAVLEIYYTPRLVSYDFQYHTSGSTGRLFLENELRRNRIGSDMENEWTLTLSNRYPVELEMDIGACEAEIDFGGLPLTSLTIDVGATSGEIDFSSPNPGRMRSLDIDAGASSLEVLNIANSHAERVSFSGGAAAGTLDFHGDLVGEMEVDLEIGVGSLDVNLPRGVAVRIEGEEGGWLSSVDFHGLRLIRIRKGVWETENFDSAKNRLVINYEVGLGSLDLYAKR